jgi:hypothetical protein
MSPRSKKEYVEITHWRYKNVSQKEKTVILDEFCATSGYHRKYAIRLLRGFKRFTKPKPKKRGPKPIYQREDTLKPLKKIWLTANLPCSKRLKAILPIWLPGYDQCFGSLEPNVRDALPNISPAMIDRLLTPVRIQYKKRGRSTTKPGTLLRKQIPIPTNQWDESRNRDFLKPTRLPTAAILLPECLFTLSIPSTSPLDGLSNVQCGEKEKPAFWNKSATLKNRFPFHCEALIPTTDRNFSIITSYAISRNERTPYALLEAEPTTKTITRISNRKTGPMSDNGSAMNG